MGEYTRAEGGCLLAIMDVVGSGGVTLVRILLQRYVIVGHVNWGWVNL